jgi:hypothetical protein
MIYNILMIKIICNKITIMIQIIEIKKYYQINNFIPIIKIINKQRKDFIKTNSRIETKCRNKFKDIKIQFMSMCSLNYILRQFLMIWNKLWFRGNLQKQARLRICFIKPKKISMINILFSHRLIENILPKLIIFRRRND